MARRGMYRVRGKDGVSNDVRIEDDGLDMPLAEALYVSRGYLPPIAYLPWEDDYFAQKASDDARQKAAEQPKSWAGAGRPAGGWLPDPQ